MKKLPQKVQRMLNYLNKQGIEVIALVQRSADGAWDLELHDGYKVSVFGLDYSVSRIIDTEEGGIQAQFSMLMRKHSAVLEKLHQYEYPHLPEECPA